MTMCSKKVRGFRPSLVGGLVLISAFIVNPFAASAANCFERLEEGAKAQVAGDRNAAERIFRAALEIDACRPQPLGPLLRFSLGRILIAQAAVSPERACEAQAQLSIARGADDPNVSKGAAALLTEAQAICLQSKATEDWGNAEPAPGESVSVDASPAESGPRARSAPDLERRRPEPKVVVRTEDNPSFDPAEPKYTMASAASESANASRWALGPRIEGGVSGLLFGRLVSGEQAPGATLGFGLAVEHQMLDTWRLLVEPAVTLTALSFSPEGTSDHEQQSVVWRRTIVEATVGAAWLPRAGDLALRFGARSGWVLDATEKSALLSDDQTPIEMARVPIDVVVGMAYDWPLAGARVRVSADTGLGVLRLNTAEDAVGWYGYRGALAVAALF